MIIIKEKLITDKEKCLEFFLLENQEFINDYNAHHIPYKYYNNQ